MTKKIVNTNPREIEWPQDRNGFLSAFKKEFLRTIERVNGHPEKEEDLIATIKVAAGFAVARIAQQKAERTATASAVKAILAGPDRDGSADAE